MGTAVEAIKNAATATEGLSIAADVFGAEGAQRTRTFGDKLDLFGNKAAVAFAPLGEKLITVLDNMLTKAEPVLQWVGSMVEGFTNLSPTIQLVIGAGVALAAALGPVLVVVGSIASAVGTILPLIGGAAGLVVGLKAAAIAAVALATAWAGWKLVEWLRGFGPVKKALDWMGEKLTKLIGWIVKLPGVSSAIDGVKEAASRVKDAFTDWSDETDDADDAVSDLDTSTGNLRREMEEATKKSTAMAASVDLSALSLKNTKDKAVEAKPKLKEFKEELGYLTDASDRAAKALADEQDSLLKATADYMVGAGKMPFTMGEAADSLDDLKESIDGVSDSFIDATDVQMPAFVQEMTNTALQVPPFVEDVGAVGTAFDDIGGKISGFVMSAAKGLWSGTESMGEKVKNLAISIRDSMLNTFITPLTTAVEDFVSGALASLLKGFGSGGGLSGLLDGLGGKIGGLFGGGGGGGAGSIIPGIPSVPGFPGGGGAGGIGGALGSVGGLAGGLNLVGNLGGMVTGVISNFQNAKQETTLNAIEHNTRFSMMFLGERGDGGIVTASLKTLEMIGYNVTNTDALKGTLWEIKDKLGSYLEELPSIASNTFWGLQKLDSWHPQVDKLSSIDSRLEAMATKPTNITADIHFDGLVAAVSAQVQADIAVAYAGQTG
jgi:hypothetical protein